LLRGEADFKDTKILPMKKIDPERFTKLEQVWMKLKPEMDEKLARQLLGPLTESPNITPGRRDGLQKATKSLRRFISWKCSAAAPANLTFLSVTRFSSVCDRLL